MQIKMVSYNNVKQSLLKEVKKKKKKEIPTESGVSSGGSQTLSDHYTSAFIKVVVMNSSYVRFKSYMMWTTQRTNYYSS